MPGFYIEDYSDRIEASAQHTALRTLCRMWRARAGDDVPTLCDFAPLPGDIDASSLLLVPVGDELVYVRYGRNLVSAFGHDFTGQVASSIPGAPGTFFNHFYREVMAGSRPRLTVNQAQLAPSVQMWERLCLPVRISTGRALLVAIAPRTFKTEVLDAVLDANLDAIFALGAMTDEFGTLFNARIIFANAAASHHTGKSREELQISEIATVFPDIFENGVFELIRKAINENGLIRYDTANPQGLRRGTYRVSIAPWRSGATISFADITDVLMKSPTEILPGINDLSITPRTA